jgi:hypothetical protein
MPFNPNKKINFIPSAIDYRERKLKSLQVDDNTKKELTQNQFQRRLNYILSLIPPNKFKSLLEWTLYVRPTVAGRPNFLKYLTFWHDIYLDDWAWVMLLIARQMWKSNYLASRMGYVMTKRPGSTVLYGTYENPSLTEFSKKFRNQLWRNSPILRQFVRGATLGSATSVELMTDSMAWLITHYGGFTHAEGKSTDEQDWDEGQYLDWESYFKAKKSQSFTNGKFCAAGIGGDEDSGWHKMWKESDKREWTYDKDDVYVDTAGKEWIGQGWRKHLQFDENGLIWGDYMTKDHVLDGSWKPTNPDPESKYKHGYHLSQYMAPWIALSKADAVNLYKLLPSDSIQGDLEDPNMTHNDFVKQVEAGFVRGDVIPFAKQSLYDICDPRLLMQKPHDVDYELGQLYHGADWGGGNRTVEWVYQAIDDEIPVFRLIHARKLETNDRVEQAEEVATTIDEYSVKQSVIDGGGGTSQVQFLEKEFGNRVTKFFWLKRPGNPTAKDRKEEYKWKSENMWQYDKTWMMERIKGYIEKPNQQGTQKINRLIWPGKDMEQIDWVIDQFTNERTEKIKLDTGAYYIRYFTPDPDKQPDDALMANNFSITAWDIGHGKGTGHTGGGLPGSTDNSRGGIASNRDYSRSLDAEDARDELNNSMFLD